MYEYHDQYERARHRGDVDAQARWTRQLTWEVARHAVGEEIVVYPLMEKYLGEKGNQLANHDRQDHLVRIIISIFIPVQGVLISRPFFFVACEAVPVYSRVCPSRERRTP